jgi:hypothetical protein
MRAISIIFDLVQPRPVVQFSLTMLSRGVVTRIAGKDSYLLPIIIYNFTAVAFTVIQVPVFSMHDLLHLPWLRHQPSTDVT